MAGFEQPKSYISAPAGEDFTAADLYIGVGLTATGLTKAAAATAPVGVLYLPEKTGIACKVMTEGIAMCQVKEKLAMGDKVSFDANGLLVKATTGTVIGIMQADAEAKTVGAVLLQL